MWVYVILYQNKDACWSMMSPSNVMQFSPHCLDNWYRWLITGRLCDCYFIKNVVYFFSHCWESLSKMTCQTKAMWWLLYKEEPWYYNLTGENIKFKKKNFFDFYSAWCRGFVRPGREVEFCDCTLSTI